MKQSYKLWCLGLQPIIRSTTLKWAGAHEDVLAFFSPAWLSPLENACLWVTGWKPSMVFQVIDRLRKTTVMSEEQVINNLVYILTFSFHVSHSSSFLICEVQHV